MPKQPERRKLLVLATLSTSYPGADNAGQMHLSYPADAVILGIPSPVIFPDDFYLRCFQKGFAGILLATGGEECPYAGIYEKLSTRIDRVYKKMKEVGIETKRLRMVAICTVCAAAFVKEVRMMHEKVLELPPIEEVYKPDK